MRLRLQLPLLAALAVVAAATAPAGAPRAQQQGELLIISVVPPRPAIRPTVEHPEVRSQVSPPAEAMQELLPEGFPLVALAGDSVVGSVQSGAQPTPGQTLFGDGLSPVASLAAGGGLGSGGGSALGQAAAQLTTIGSTAGGAASAAGSTVSQATAGLGAAIVGALGALGR